MLRFVLGGLVNGEGGSVADRITVKSMSGYDSEWKGRSAGMPEPMPAGAGMSGSIGTTALFCPTAPFPKPKRYPEPPCRSQRNWANAALIRLSTILPEPDGVPAGPER